MKREEKKGTHTEQTHKTTEKENKRERERERDDQTRQMEMPSAQGNKTGLEHARRGRNKDGRDPFMAIPVSGLTRVRSRTRPSFLRLHCRFARDYKGWML